MADQSQPSPQKPKKSRWWLWVCGSCSCLVIVLIVVFFIISSVTGFNLEKYFDGGSGSITETDEEDRVMTKDELVDYFVDLTTIYGGNNMPIKLMKWDKPVVTISPMDEPTPNGIKIIDDFITMFNANSTTTQLQRVDKGGDIKVYFKPAAGDAAGSAGPSSGADYVIDSATVKFGENAAVFEQTESQIFAHEMFHVLGFVGHYTGETCRLMSKNTCGSHVSKNEEKLIQMLYSTDISAELDETQIRTFFQNWQPK